MSSSWGYVSALVSCVAFGSFAVPIKGKTANRVDIDPLVMQTYKTALCFLTSWSVLLLGEELTLTPWGLLSGLFWVPGGTAGIYAVRTAGLAVSQGTWSTLKILVAFVWGLCIFDERVRSRTNATVAILFMMMGLWGMSFFSSPRLSTRIRADGDDMESIEAVEELSEPLLPTNDQVDPDLSTQSALVEEDEATDNGGEVDTQDSDRGRTGNDDVVEGWRCFGLNRRQLGLLGAVIDGIWGGSILVPMHFARRDAEGLGFVISFAIGASTVLIVMWCIRLAYNASRAHSWRQAWYALPRLHLGCMWLPGGIAGLLWSLGNITSIVSVQSLGEFVGYSIVQAQMLVAGLWGVLWYREVQGTKAVAGWFLCACLTLGGVVLLGHEHIRS